MLSSPGSCLSFESNTDGHMRTVVALLTAVVVHGAVTGCYRLTPIEGGVPPAGADVRLDLSDAGAVRLAPLIGPRIAAIDGKTVQATDSAIDVAVQAVVSQGGRSMPWSLEKLSVPRSAVTAVRGRTLDRTRSWLVAGLGVLAVVGLGQSFGLGTGFDGLFGWIGGGGGKS